MGRSQRHMVEEQGSAATGSAVNQGVVAPGLLLQAGEPPASADPLEVLRGIENVVVPMGAPGGPLAGSSLTGPIPSELDTGGGGGGGTDPEPGMEPTLTSLDPNTVEKDSANITMRCLGTNFTDSSVIVFAGVDEPTTFVSDTEITTGVTPTLGWGTDVGIPVHVRQGTYETAPLDFIFTAVPAAALPPGIMSLSPQAMVEGTASLDVTIYGNNFVDGCVAMLGAVSLPTVFNSPTNLTATLAFPEYNPSIYMISVTNPDAQVSAAKMFYITAAKPVLDTVTPNACDVGAAPFTVAAVGSNFVNGSQIEIGGGARATTFIDANNLTAEFDLSAWPAGPQEVRVGNPNGDDSNALTFTINTVGAAAPVVTSISPTTAVVGDPPVAMTVVGTGFEAASVVQFWGANVPTVFVSATELTATVTLDGYGASEYPVSVMNGVVSSNSVLFPVTDPVARSKAKAEPKPPAKRK